MPELLIEILSISQRFEPNADGVPQVLTDLLFFPELSTFGHELGGNPAHQAELLGDLVKARPPEDLARRLLPSPPMAGQIQVTIIPSGVAPESPWTKPVTLSIPAVRWNHGSDTIAYVPSLGIEIVSRGDESPEQRLSEEVLAAIQREAFASSLLDLAYLDRCTDLDLRSIRWKATPRSPVEDALVAAGTGSQQASTLDEVATRLEPKKMRPAFRREALVEQFAAILAAKEPSSVLLVGPSGVGKTAIVHELVRRKAALGLSHRPVFRSSGSRLVAGMCGFGMWQERCRKLVKDAASKRAVLHLGSLLELMEVGQSTASSESIASFLRPHIVRGELLTVAECTAEQLSLIEQKEPKLLDAFRQLLVPEPSPEVARGILQDVAGSDFTGPALARTSALFHRYSGYSAFPGRPLRFLERVRSAARHGSSGDPAPLDPAAVLDAFSRETGIPEVLLSDDRPLELAGAREWFATRIAGQEAAVELVLDTLATIKANLNRPGKPLASFLFIGPTGVGKTELAKVLAEFLYRSRDRLIRLDMSEFNHPFSAARLVSQAGSSGKEGLLTAKVREQPFSVILLDEFEKADPAVFDLFLQVLGEGRLTDAAGRVADFTSSVIIMTSNLGAREFQRGSLGFGAGSDTGSQRATEHFTTAVKAALRPELFNRIDKILPFLPLPRTIVRSLIEREVALAQERDGFAGRNVALDVDPEVAERLADLGHDPRYGARPLKRAVERHLLRPAAEALAATKREGATLKARLDPANGRIVISWERSRVPPGAKRPSHDHRDAQEIAQLRREYRQLQASPLVAALEAERSRLQQRGRVGDTVPPPPRDDAGKARLRHLRRILVRVAAEAEGVSALEVALAAGVPASPTAEDPTREGFESLLTDLLTAAANHPPECTLVIGGAPPSAVARLASAYAEIARALGSSATPYRYPRHPSETTLVNGHLAVIPQPHAGDLAAPDPQTVALALTLDSPEALIHLVSEAGLHTFPADPADHARRPGRCTVAFLPVPVAAAALPLDDLVRPDFARFPLRRAFNDEGGRDTLLDHSFRSPFSVDLLRKLVEDALDHLAHAVLS
ncbi:hypothetical protein BH23VER1_BH23VER1_03050 [soil metagenome]